jgi:hypothetical protein
VNGLTHCIKRFRKGGQPSVRPCLQLRFNFVELPTLLAKRVSNIRKKKVILKVTLHLPQWSLNDVAFLITGEWNALNRSTERHTFLLRRCESFTRTTPRVPRTICVSLLTINCMNILNFHWLIIKKSTANLFCLNYTKSNWNELWERQNGCLKCSFRYNFWFLYSLKSYWSCVSALI